MGKKKLVSSYFTDVEEQTPYWTLEFSSSLLDGVSEAGPKKYWLNLTLSKSKTSVLQKTSLSRWKDKLQNGRKYLQTTCPTNNRYLEYIKKPQDS